MAIILVRRRAGRCPSLRSGFSAQFASVRHLDGLSVRTFLFAFAKTWLGGLLLHFVFSHFTFAIPTERLLETTELIAFYHPSPSYPLHIIIVPRARIKSLSDLGEMHYGFMIGLFEAVGELVDRFDLRSVGYRLIANGGKDQEVDYLHFHLISEDYSVK